MRIYILTLLALAMALDLVSVECLDTATIIKLTTQAAELAAPFTNSGASRLHNVVFGTGRAARSSDVIISNTSGKDFRLKKTHCHWGGWSTGMFPEHMIPKHSSTAFGMESNGFMTGVECEARYKGSGDSNFHIVVGNPYWSRVRESHDSSSDLNILKTLGQGNNNNVRYIIEDK